MRMRPKRGKVLVEMLPLENQTESGLALAERRRLKDFIGRMPAQLARVICCGVWPVTKTGRMIQYEFRPGNLVFVDPTMGTNLSVHPKRLKLFDHTQILAVA